MARREIRNTLDRINRNNHNDNYEELYKEVKETKNTISDLVREGDIDSLSEVVQARQGEKTLSDKLDSMKDEYSYLYSQLDNSKSDKRYINKKIDEVDGRIDLIITDQAEGISQQEIIDARQGKSSLGSNISSIKNEIDVGLVNRVVNGNMEQGRFGWSEYTGTTVEPKDDHILLKGDGKHNQLRIRQHDDYGVSKLAYKSGNKIYVSCEIKVKDSDAEYAGFRVWSTEGDSGFNDVEIRNPKKEKLNTISGTFTLGEGGSGNFYLQIRVGYPNSSMQNNKEVEVGKILFIDLTDAFGEGNEPNKKQMDYLLKLHEGHWFEKANVGSVAMSVIGGSHKGSDNSTNHDLPIVNGVKNSDFKDENNWNTLSGTTSTVSNNRIKITGTGGNKLVRVYQKTNIPYKVGHKIYARVEFEPDNDDVRMAGVYMNADSEPKNETQFRLTAPKKHESYIVSGIMENKDNTGQGYVALYLRVDYQTKEKADSNSCYFGNVIAIDLTEAFGKGNEPSDREKIDNIIDKLPNRHFNNRPNKSDWEMAIYSYNMQFTKEKKALICLTIDDGNTTDYTKAYPLYYDRGLKGTSWLIGDNMNTDDDRWLNSEMIQEMHDDGWDFQCHTFSHKHLPELSDSNIRKEFENNNNLFESLDLPKPQHCAFPYGSWNQKVIDIGLEYRKTLRTTGQTSGIYFNEWDRPQLGALNSKSIDVSDDNIEEINNIKKIIDDTISNRGALILYHHQLVDNPGQYEAKTEHVETILDYIKEKIDSGDIESVTISELYNRLNDYR